jgi:hypothetical protein
MGIDIAALAGLSWFWPPMSAIWVMLFVLHPYGNQPAHLIRTSHISIDSKL